VNRRATTLTATALALVALTGCTATAGPAPTNPVASTPAATGTASATPAPTGTATAAAATCDGILDPSVVKSLSDQGWTFRQESFRAGSTVLTGGLQCVWGDYSIASDHVQIYGWAPISAEQAVSVRTDLLAQGFRAVEDSRGSYLTENANTAIATDADGYGTTYQFGDGWITLSDTKQGLLLIERPAA
jgi:hypothetical protein